ncbi:aldo/keto reductase [Sediminivirga luteola]|uniref:Oxidoreductase n=1 Tax=Sediminivirga luteola TaxID=1774748 RepID=A0A8J2XHK3_9MICO|nr:aldo/keto reductase [Sediminivirga luteola]GGA01947.1 oxidoreductase [Sediminivirga luteola]
MSALAENQPWIELNDGTTLPAIGFGTYPLFGRGGTEAVSNALQAGYRLIDTAYNYENEGTVGAALAASGLDRGAYRVQSKLAGRYHEYDKAIAATEESLMRLGLDYLDSLIIHWPNPIAGKYVEAWRALVELKERGLVRSIGVSNFEPEHLERVIEATGVVPAVNQIELHPYFVQSHLREVHATLGIVTQAWRPLGKRNPAYHEEPVAAAAAAHGVSPAQVILRWHIQLGVLPLPKSATPERQRSNLDVFGFELSAAEVEAISALDSPEGRSPGLDPNSHEEF